MMQSGRSTPANGNEQSGPRAVILTDAHPEETPHSEMLAWALEQCGWDVTLVSPSGNRGVARATLGGHWKCREPARGTLNRWTGTLKELLLARFGSYDVVCIHSVGLAYRAAPFLLGPLRCKKLVYFNPDYCDPIRYPWRSRIEGLLARRADLHLNHEYHRGYIAAAQHRMKCPVVVVPPSLPKCWPIAPRDEQLRADLAGRSGKSAFILRLHGGFSPLRKTSELLAALQLLPKEVRLVMTRPAEDNHRDLALLKKNELQERVVLLPAMRYNEMLRYSVNTDAGVLLYANNDLGNFFQSPGRLTEYLACGLPVLSSAFTGLENLVMKHDIGVCVDAERPERIADGVARLWERREKGELGSNDVREKFEREFAYENWLETVAQSFDRLIESDGERRGKQAFGVGEPPFNDVNEQSQDRAAQRRKSD